LTSTTVPSILCCPCVEKALIVAGVENAFVCSREGCLHSQPAHAFKHVQNVPILISFQKCDTVCQSEQYTGGGSKKFYSVTRSTTSLGQRARKLLSGTNGVTLKNCKKFVELVAARAAQTPTKPRVLVIGSGTRGSGTEALWDSDAVTNVGIDIYPSESTDYVADAHYLPFVDGAFDGVWIQAVLEHVADPNLVVQEIHRVLAKGGIVYADTPFMQQVHEGAYDFQRYSVLGHRFLFRAFTALDMGGNRGPGVVLAWSIRYFVWAITRSKLAAKVISAPFAVAFGLLDRLTDKRGLWDGPSGVYFLGSKSDQVLKHSELPKAYQGFQI
jgi:SAM-dependent methyltransferase